MLQNIKILGVNIANEKTDRILEYFFSSIKSPKAKMFIITPNPEMLVYACKHLDYQNRLNRSTIALPDGVGLFFASGFMGENLKERTTGVDFIEKICEKSHDFPLSIGFLGGKDKVAEQTAERLIQKYPWIKVIFVAKEWSEKGFNWKKDGHKTKQIDILFVAFGVPKQEEWISKHLDSLPVKAAMGVGGAFDFLSGSIPRAPFIIRFAGLEWLFRLIIEPWRWKRQLALIEFIYLVFKQTFSPNTK
jgi:N-acetylglucosaminyldiphosphoundecaprenol N-acetyl-beta-D-mannosaminyltransferase